MSQKDDMVEITNLHGEKISLPREVAERFNHLEELRKSNIPINVTNLSREERIRIMMGI